MSKNTFTTIREVHSATTHVVAFCSGRGIRTPRAIFLFALGYEPNEFGLYSIPQCIFKNVLFYSFVARTGYDPVAFGL